MSVTEQPVDIVATRNGGPFVLGDHTRRVNWINSFFVSSNPNLVYITSAYGYTPPIPFIGYGAVNDSLARTHDQIGFNQGVVGTFQQIYVSEPSGGVLTGQVVQTGSLNPTFPAGSLPIAVIVLDGVQRVQQVIDFRPSGLSSAPNLGSGMTESVVDATKRVYFQNNYTVPRTYALSAQIPADLAIPSPGFFLGSGAVVISGNTISTPSTYLAATRGGQLASGINQGYIDPSTGLLAIRIVQTSGVFPGNSLPLFEATVDGVNLIRSLVDWRPSFI